MKYIYYFFFIFIVLLLSSGCTGRYVQYKEFPAKIKLEEGDYVHERTKTHFPNKIAEYPRTEAFKFDSEEKSICVNYGSGDGRDLTISVYINPAPIAYESRLLNAYSNAVTAAVELLREGNPKITHERVFAFTDGYRLLGLRGCIETEAVKSVVVLFECGRYFLKYRITSKSYSMYELVRISDMLTYEFQPLEIVKHNPLKNRVSYAMSLAYQFDFTSWKPILAAVETKAAWVNGSIDSLELCAGYPSLYFEAHKVSLQAMLKEWLLLREEDRKTSQIRRYMEELKFIDDSGMLNEYIYDSYYSLLFLPAGVVLDMDKYRRWKAQNKPTLQINGTPFYDIFVLS